MSLAFFGEHFGLLPDYIWNSHHSWCCGTRTAAFEGSLVICWRGEGRIRFDYNRSGLTRWAWRNISTNSWYFNWSTHMGWWTSKRRFEMPRQASSRWLYRSLVQLYYKPNISKIINDIHQALLPIQTHSSRLLLFWAFMAIRYDLKCEVVFHSK